jgi:hypothetical protein
MNSFAVHLFNPLLSGADVVVYDQAIVGCKDIFKWAARLNLIVQNVYLPFSSML